MKKESVKNKIKNLSVRFIRKNKSLKWGNRNIKNENKDKFKF